MRQVYDRIFVGNHTDCEQVDKSWAVVHACKYPCWADVVGLGKARALPKSHPHYLYYRSGDHLYLNLVDSNQPLFMPQSFSIFLDFMQEMYDEGKTILIHCNMGFSRSPSLALLFLAKRLRVISDELYNRAVVDYAKLDANFFPGAGLRYFMTFNWKNL